jgi:glycerol-3-phosphate dehydrogenase (NAD(P)+)
MNELLDYKIGIIGAGSWGTTLAQLLAEKGFNVTLWVYEKELFRILGLGRCNTWYLPDIALDPKISFTCDMEEAVRNKQMVLWVAPVKAFGKLFAEGFRYSLAEAIHVSASKGIETETLKTVSQIAAQSTHNFKDHKFAVISGPSFAAEVSRKMPTAVVVASKDIQSARIIQNIMATPFFRTYSSEDILGVEIGGALKNVIAIASGISEGLALGHNTRAALITRGLVEIMRLGSFLGADPRTFTGLSGLGDLVLTCTSNLSRNYRVGVSIGKGQRLGEVLKNMKMVAEGVNTTKAAFTLSSESNIEMPIVQEIYQVLFKNKSPQGAVKDLMRRELKQEFL